MKFPQNSLQKPIFIVGYLHSGTTLLQHVLSRHPDVFVPESETAFFYVRTTLEQQFPDLSSDPIREAYLQYLLRIINDGFLPHEFEDMHNSKRQLGSLGISSNDYQKLLLRTDSVRDHALCYRMVLDIVAESHQKSRWVEKTPNHIYYVDDILRVIPDALIVSIIRDPRDVLASKKLRRSATWLDHRSGGSDDKKAVLKLQTGYDPILDTMGWRAAVRASAKAKERYPNSVCQIRYEDFVTDPVKVTKELCDFLRLDFAPDLLQVSWGNTTTRSQWSKSGISAAAIGKWESVLSPESVNLCQRVAILEMREMSYQTAPASKLVQFRSMFSLFNTGFELFSRIFRRWRLGGVTYLRAVIYAYLTQYRQLRN